MQLFLDIDFNNDKAISAIEFRPGNKEAVHHALVTYVESGSADYLDEQDDEYEDSEAKKGDDEDGDWDAEDGSKTNLDLDLTDDSKRVLDSDVLQVYFQKMGSHTLLNAEQEKEVSKRIEDGVMEMKRVFCFSLPVQDYLGKLLLDLKNNKVRAVRLIAGLDEDDNLIEDENKAQKKLITSLDRYQKIAEQFRGFTSKTGKKEREKITKQLEKYLLKISQMIFISLMVMMEYCYSIPVSYTNMNLPTKRIV